MLINNAKLDSPEEQAKASPVNGQIPPQEHRFKPGQSGNPRGRPSAGASVIEWFNTLQDATEDELERIARSASATCPRRAAAVQWLEILAEAHDLSDFEKYCNGEQTLAELKKSGISTRRIKKIKVCRSGDVVTREIELSDKGGAIIDRTVGRAVTRSELSISDSPGVAKLLAMLKEKASVSVSNGDSGP